MKVNEIIEQLRQFRQDAEVEVRVVSGASAHSIDGQVIEVKEIGCYGNHPVIVAEAYK